MKNMEYDYESKNLDELRMDFLSEKYDNVLFTKEMARDIVLKIHYETAINNKEEFLDSLKKLISLDNAYSKLSYEIDKVKILKYLRKEIVNEKAFQIATLKAGITNTNPIDTIRKIEIYELLLDYLENDKAIKEGNDDNYQKTK